MSSGLQALGLFLFVFVLRYLRTVVGIVVNIRHRPIALPANPQFKTHDATVIIPSTFKTPAELLKCISSIQQCDPAQIFLVVATAKLDDVQDFLKVNEIFNVITLGVAKLNKRQQILEALPHVKTSVTVLADDDVIWPESYLDYLLPIFENPTVGAGGTRQRVRREPRLSVVHFLGTAYLERRVWNNITTNAVDGSISTLSGRTSAFRTEILQGADFAYQFTHDTWFGRPLNSDDDKFLTRYVYSHGWNISIQTDARSVIETTLETDWKFMSQCMRWARAHWRGNFTVMTNERYWRSPKYIWGFFVIYLCQFMTPAAFWDALLFVLLREVLLTWHATHPIAVVAYCTLSIWIIFTKIVKLLPHFRKYPADVVYIPASILFSYLHGIINICALLTLNVTHWGSQQLNVLEEKQTALDMRTALPAKVRALPSRAAGSMIEKHLEGAYTALTSMPFV